MGLRMKSYGGSLKNPIFRGRFMKNQYIWGNCLKKEALAVYRFKGEAQQKRRGVRVSLLEGWGGVSPPAENLFIPHPSRKTPPKQNPLPPTKFLSPSPKLPGVQHITCLKQQHLLSFTVYKTQRSYKKIMCIYLLFH